MISGQRMRRALNFTVIWINCFQFCILLYLAETCKENKNIFESVQQQGHSELEEPLMKKYNLDDITLILITVV